MIFFFNFRPFQNSAVEKKVAKSLKHKAEMWTKEFPSGSDAHGSPEDARSDPDPCKNGLPEAVEVVCWPLAANLEKWNILKLQSTKKSGVSEKT